MAIQPVQINTEYTKSQPVKEKKVVKPYIEAQGAVKTDKNVKPLPPKGHLISNDPKSSVKYFFKDIAYDAKALKDGFLGKANDHQLGRLNDVGLKLGGIGIATYLASITTNPKVRIMEYIGLGTFLTSMNIYPKLAINTPAKLKHGFDIDKEYIDDQGRKKSVMQDSNYIPFDMYRGARPDEDLAVTGDKLGIPRDIKNRNDVIREQQRKISTQNNTLWMLTAGGATPVLTALICCGLENYVIAPGLEKQRNAKYNKMIAEVADKLKNMSENVSSEYSNTLSKDISKNLKPYSGKELPFEEFEALVNKFTYGLDNQAATGIKEDLKNLLKYAKAGDDLSYIVDKSSLSETVNNMASKLNVNQKSNYGKVLVPTEAELESLIKKIAPEADLEVGITLSKSQLETFKGLLRDFITEKLVKEGKKSEFACAKRNQLVEIASKSFKTRDSYFLSEDALNKVTQFAKVIGDFKEINKMLIKCESFKFEFAPETVLARSYAKFERAFLKELGFTTSELKILRENEEYAEKEIEKRLTEICKDDAKYKKVMEKFGKIISEMEASLHGKNGDSSKIKDLITAFEDNYHLAAKRLDSLGGQTFSNSIKKLVAEDVSTLANSLNSVEDLYAWLDGTNSSKVKSLLDKIKHAAPEDKPHLRSELAKEFSKGAGSSKENTFARIRARYGGVRNSFNRVIHLFDLYHRGLSPQTFADGIKLASNKQEYIQEIIKKGKEAVLKGSTADFILKLKTTNNPQLFIDVMNAVWSNSSELKGLGHMSTQTAEALDSITPVAGGSLKERFGAYLTRIRNIFGNDYIDFTKPRHIIDSGVLSLYDKAAVSNESKFNLLAKSPLDMIREGAGRKYGDNKWLRIVSTVTAGVFGVAILSQFGFGKLRNPQNLMKQVNDDSN